MAYTNNLITHISNTLNIEFYLLLKLKVIKKKILDFNKFLHLKPESFLLAKILSLFPKCNNTRNSEASISS